VTDVDGTTTDPGYFGQTVIPYMKKNCLKFVCDSYRNRSTRDVIDKLREESRNSRYPIPKNGSDREIARAVEDNLYDQINNKSFTESSLALNLLITMEGYSRGDLKAHMYQDVSSSLYVWKEKMDICVISSGIPEVVKLMFTFSVDGSIDSLISRYLSTDDVGSKKARRTFIKMQDLLDIASSRDALFLTDDPRESKAAKDAGWTAVLVSRDGKQFSMEEERDSDALITSFDQLVFE
jgi:enolase-phosphatase E1